MRSTCCWRTPISRDGCAVIRARVWKNSIGLPCLTKLRILLSCAAISAHTLNKSDLAAPLGVSVPTIIEWLDILQVTNQIILVPPYFENFGKRLIKSPKIYWGDAGLACHLLGIRSTHELERSPFLGPLF